MNLSLRFSVFAALAVVAVPGFAQMSSKPTMFDKLGGLQKIAMIVDRAVDMEVMDPMLTMNPRFKAIATPAMRPALKFLVTQGLAATTGGMQTMPKPGFFEIQAWLAFDKPQRERAWMHRMKAMDEAGIAKETQMELRAWIDRETMKAKPMAPPMKEPFMNKNSLYARLGGIVAISAVCDVFINRLATDPVIGANGNVVKALASGRITGPGLKTLLIEQIAEATGGPFKYTGRTMVVSHKGLMITEAEWEAGAKILKGVLDEFNVPAREQMEVLDLIASTKGDIVGR